MRSVFLNTPEDMQWLADVHTQDVVYASAMLYGNEDAPERIDCYHSVAPLHNQIPDAVYISDADGNLVMQS